jgi:hypothetical protein
MGRWKKKIQKDPMGSSSQIGRHEMGGELSIPEGKVTLVSTQGRILEGTPDGSVASNWVRGRWVAVQPRPRHPRT